VAGRRGGASSERGAGSVVGVGNGSGSVRGGEGARGSVRVVSGLGRSVSNSKGFL